MKSTTKHKRGKPGADGPMRKKRNQSAARDSRLFALLMSDECNSRAEIDPFWAMDYLTFLRAQSNHSDALCPYKRAVAMVEGRS